MGTRLRRRVPGALTPAEAEAFRSVVHVARDRAAVSLMLDAGLRASEVVGLRLDQIDWKDQVLRFVGKGGKAAVLPMSSRLRDELERAIRARPAQAVHPYLLYDLRSPVKPISRFALLKMVKGYARKAGLERRVFCHLLRHTFGTSLFRETGDLGRTQAAMRHSKIATTTIYMHLTPDDQRGDFERIDARPWLFRWWSRLRPVIMPDALKPRSAPLMIGETVGRGDELSRLRRGIRQRMHTVLVGERGVGRRHLLREMLGECGVRSAECGVRNEEREKAGMEVVHLEAFSPARECLVTLCNELKSRGLIEQVPTGRSDTAFLEALRRVGRARAMILIIDAITDIARKERQNLRRLAETWTIVTSIDRQQAARLGVIFFGHYQRIDIEPFDKATAMTFARKAMGGMRVPDERAYLNHVYAQSQGNAQAILELIDATRKTGEETPTHAAVQRVLPAAVFLAAFAMIGFMVRYSASTMSEPTLRVYAILFIVAMAGLVVVDKVLCARAR